MLLLLCESGKKGLQLPDSTGPPVATLIPPERGGGRGCYPLHPRLSLHGVFYFPRPTTATGVVPWQAAGADLGGNSAWSGSED